MALWISGTCRLGSQTAKILSLFYLALISYLMATHAAHAEEFTSRSIDEVSIEMVVDATSKYIKKLEG